MNDKAGWENGGNAAFAQFVIVGDVMYLFKQKELSYRDLDLDTFNEEFPGVNLGDMQAFGALEMEHMGNGVVARTIVSAENMPQTGNYSRDKASEYLNGPFVKFIGQTRENPVFSIMV